MNNTALVTGGAGFIGTNLILKLLSEDINVISIDDYSTGLKSNHIDSDRVTYLDYDITNSIDLVDSNVDIIYHLAAKARIQPSFDQPIDYFKVNSYGTINICEYARKNNIPIIYAGSSSHHNGKFKNPYTFSKDIGEDIIKLYHKLYNLKYSISRFYNVYGDYELVDSDYATLIGKCKYSIINKLPITIYGDGTKYRDFTHVKYIVDALYRIYDMSKYYYEFELGTGKNYSINEVVSMFDYSDIIYKPNKEGEANVTLANNTTAKLQLDWYVDDILEDYINKLKMDL